MKAAVAWRRSTWFAPVVLAMATAVGLISALVGDGAWDAVSWAGLGLPILAACWYGLRRSPVCAGSGATLDPSRPSD